MKNTYFNLINQTYQFPQEGFNLEEGQLTFHGIPIKNGFSETVELANLQIPSKRSSHKSCQAFSDAYAMGGALQHYALIQPNKRPRKEAVSCICSQS